jgi:hypothetical protein
VEAELTILGWTPVLAAVFLVCLILFVLGFLGVIRTAWYYKKVTKEFDRKEKAMLDEMDAYITKLKQDEKV